MAERDNIQSLLVRRKLTRAIADVVRADLTQHLATLNPLFQPQTVLGDRIQGGQSDSMRKVEQAFKDASARVDAAL